MSKIKIALCQMNVIDNKQENISKAVSMINEAVSYNPDFVVPLPVIKATLPSLVTPNTLLGYPLLL